MQGEREKGGIRGRAEGKTEDKGRSGKGERRERGGRSRNDFTVCGNDDYFFPHACGLYFSQHHSPTAPKECLIKSPNPNTRPPPLHLPTSHTSSSPPTHSVNE